MRLNSNEKEDEGQDTAQLGEFGHNRAGQGLRGLQQRRVAGVIRGRNGRKGKGSDGIWMKGEIAG